DEGEADHDPDRRVDEVAAQQELPERLHRVGYSSPRRTTLRLEGQLCARPLVPRARVVARLVAGGAEHLRGDPRAHADVAVDDDFRRRLDAEALAQRVS